MKTEPASFYLGVIDVFSIMLPGALLAYFVPELLSLSTDVALLQQPGNEPHEWLVFLFAAYLFGHIVFLLGSFLDRPYDGLIRRRFWPDVKEFAYLRAEIIKENAIGEENAQAINTFQWAKSVLALQHPEAGSEVARLEAASKFFRSLFVVFAILVMLSISSDRGSWLEILGILILMGLSLWRYAERRHKSVKQACWFVITMDGFRRQDATTADSSQNLTHAGGVVYRLKDDRVEYLLVRPKSNVKEWLLPKGHIERDESSSEAAAREVREETGVVADTISRLGTIRFRAKDEDVVAEFHLMKFVRQSRADEERTVDWCSANEAMTKLSFVNYKYLLAVAEQKTADSET